MTQSIEHVSADENAEQIEKVLLEEGAVIVDRLVGEEFVERIHEEISPWFDRTQTADGEWLGFKTRRLHGLLAKSAAIRENVINPLILEVMDRVLGPWCDKYQMGSCSITSLGPGESSQELHRDDLMYPFSHPMERVPHVTTFWALHDFTEENGATRVIPGSHLWDDERTPLPEETVPAEMKKGSVLITLGATYHGGGDNNSSDEWRHAMYTSYNLGWLKQEEAQFLVNPPEVARHYPERLQRLLGYQMHRPFLGWVDLQDPVVVLNDYEELSGSRVDEEKNKDGRMILAESIRRE